MTIHSIFIVDAFTDVPFAGNPAAVCLLPAVAPADIDDATMLKIAAEMNLSETAFVQPYPEDEKLYSEKGEDVFARCDRFRLRWFSPTVEVPLCGHATLASAAVLFNARKNTSSVLRFATLSGELTAAMDASSSATSGTKITMELPLNRPVVCDNNIRMPAGTTIELLRAAVPNEQDVHSVHYSASTKKLLIRLRAGLGRAYIEAMKVVPKNLVAAHNGSVVRGVIISTNDGCEGYDFISRYYAPWVGIDEDPVTGSAHTVLTPYWSEVIGSTSLKARQCSPRGGDVFVELVEDRNIVKVSGYGKLVVTGSISI